MSDAYETRDIEHNGKTYRAEFHYDQDMGAPWKEHCGHGVVSDWTRRDKKPGERVLSENRGKKLFYDVAETMRIAKRDGWGIASDKAMTPGERTAAAVEADFERMRAWCNDEWRWCGVVVFPLTADGDELRSKCESLWGIESDTGEYFNEVIQDLIDQIEG